MDVAYDAFISYSHADSAAVARLQKFLEDFRLPTPKDGAKPGRLRVFRDQTDIRTGGLSDELDTALSRSSNLIVCCSASAAQSRWVHQEVETFLGRGQGQVIPILLEGEPMSAVPAGLQGRELRYADLRNGWRLGGLLRPEARVELVRVVAVLAQADVRTFIPWELERRRRRRMMLAATIATVVLLLAVITAGWRMEAKNRELADKLAATEAKRAQSEQLQRAGESALTSSRTGDIAAAVAMLGEVVNKDKLEEFRAYHAMYRFLRPRLVDSLHLLGRLERPSLFRWRGRDYVLHADGTFVAAPFTATVLHGITGGGSHLVAISATREVNILTFPDLTRVQSFTVDNVRFLAIYEQPRTGALALVATELDLASDEDSPDAQQEMGSILVMLSAPNAKHRVLRDEAFARASCGANKDVPCGFRRISPRGEGVRSLSFPQVREEKEYWRIVKRQTVPAEEWYRSQNRLARLDFAGWCKAKDFPADCEPELLNPRFFELDGAGYVTGDVVTGNQWVSLHVCKIQNRNKVDTCQAISHTAVSRVVWSPQFRNLIITGPEVQADSFQVFEFANEIRACKGVENPRERVAGVAFRPDGKQLLVASRDGELWLYSMDTGCRIVLQKRLFNSSLARWAAAGGKTAPRVQAHFPVTGMLVLAGPGSEMVAVDAQTGFVKWSRSGREFAGELSITASNDGAALAVWDTRQIQIVHADTGAEFSSVMRFPPPGDVEAGVVRVGWLAGEGIVADWVAPPREGRPARQISYKRLGPDEAAAQFLRKGGPIESLTGLSSADGHAPLEQLK